MCAPGAISMSSSKGAFNIEIDRGKCTNCGKCIDICTVGALKVYGQYMSLNEVFDEVRKDMDFYSNSGGGVTAGGGEPLRQADFVAELFRRCRRIGIHTTLDTCGYARDSTLKKVLTETDLVLFDLKLMNSKQHRQFTKRDNWVIHRNALLVVAERTPMIIRIPLIPGINDSEENLRESARFVSELDNKLPVNLLSYHRFGVNKYKMLDRDYQGIDLRPPNEEQLQKAMGIFQQRGLNCIIEE
jgi:pyruvate formate lyase activating enzyme